MPPPNRRALLGLAGLMAAGIAAAEPQFNGLARQVAQAERAFARAMAECDYAAFTSWLSGHAVFLGAR